MLLVFNTVLSMYEINDIYNKNKHYVYIRNEKFQRHNHVNIFIQTHHIASFSQKLYPWYICPLNP